MRGKRVCEVGCGLGIAGIAAAIAGKIGSLSLPIDQLCNPLDQSTGGAGASQVVLTDREPLALECALRTAKASGLASVACTHGDDMNRAAQHQVSKQISAFPKDGPCFSGSRSNAFRRSPHNSWTGPAPILALANLM